MKKSQIKPNNSGSEASQRIKLDIPKYRGLENERLIKFLSEFEKYINVVRPNFDQLLCLISQALKGDAKQKIEFGQHQPGGNLHRVEYATNLFGLEKELDLEYTETEFVVRVREHFERNIRHAVLGQQVKDKNMLLKILADCAGDDERHRKRDKISHNKPSPHSNTANTQNKSYSKPYQWQRKMEM